jgi:DNA primase
MTTDELQQLVTVSGLSCRVKSDEVALHVCPFCGNEKWNMELSAVKGVYHCWACRTGGRLDAFLHQLTGQQFHIDVTKQDRKKQAKATPPDALDFQSLPVADVLSANTYLAKRGITADLAAMYGIRVCTQVGHLLEARIVIPAREFWTGELLGWMGRSYTGKRPKYKSTLGRQAIIGWRQHSRKVPIVMVEGALDGIAVHRAGFTAAVLGGSGVEDAEVFAARAIENSLIVMLDGDAGPQATRLYWRLKTVHTNVRLQYLEPGQDPAGLGPEIIRDLLSAQPLASDRHPD